tara:strand:+ start:172 stop:681 length:510 start_codon:yes stop_codon:yes gene_type:complete
MATNKVLFLSVDYLRDNTVINGDVDSELLEPYILMAQNIHMEACLGTKIYKDLIDTIAALSVNNKILMDDYIQPALLQWSLYESLPFINYRLTNKAISTKSSDNSDPVSLDELHYLREAVKNAAEYLSERITVHLKANTDIYPLYLTNGDSCDNILPNKTNYNSGIVFY